MSARLTAETATRRLAHDHRAWRTVSFLGLEIIAIVRLLMAALVFFRSLILSDVSLRASSTFTLTVGLAYPVYAWLQFRLARHTRQTRHIGRILAWQIVLDVIFAAVLQFTYGDPYSLAFLVFGPPIALAAWYLNLPTLLVVAGISLAVSFLMDVPSPAREWVWTLVARGALFFVGGFGLQVVRGLMFRQALEEAHEEVLAAEQAAYLVDPAFNLQVANAAVIRRHGPYLPGTRCHQYLAGIDQPCPDCPVQIAIQRDLIGHRRELTFRDQNGSPYPVEVTAYRVRGHDGGSVAQAGRAHILYLPETGANTDDIPAEERARIVELAFLAGRQLEVLHDLGLAVLGYEYRPLPEILQIVREHLQRIINVDHWYIALHDRLTNTLTFPAFYVRGDRVEFGDRIWNSDGYTEYVLSQCQPLYISDRLNAAEKHPVPGMVDQYPYRSWAGVPLAVGGQVFGVMAAQSEAPAWLSAAEFDTFKLCGLQVAHVLAGVLKRQALLHDPASAARWGLAEVSPAPTADTVGALLRPVFTAIAQVIDYDAASLQRVQGNQLRIVAVDGFDNPLELRGLAFPLSEDYPNAQVYTARRVICWADVRQDFAAFADPSLRVGRIGRLEPLDEHPRSMLGLPLLRPPFDEPAGVLVLDKFEADYYTRQDSAKAAIIAPFIADRIVQTYDYLQRWIQANRFATLQLLNTVLAARGAAAHEQAPQLAARLIAEAFGLSAGLYLRDKNGVRRLAWVSAMGNAAAEPPAIESQLLRQPASESTLYPDLMPGMVCIKTDCGDGCIAWLCGAPAAGQPDLNQEDVSILRSALNLISPHVMLMSAADEHGAALRYAADPKALADLLDSLPISALCENQAGYITYANERLLALLGLDSADVIGQHFLRLVAPAEHDHVQTEWAARADGQPGKYTTVLRGARDVDIPVWVDARPRLVDGQLHHVVVSFVAQTSQLRSQKLYEELMHGLLQVRVERTNTTAHVLRAVRDTLTRCGLASMIFQLDKDGRHLRVRDVSFTPAMLKRINRAFGLQLLGQEVPLQPGSHWHTVVTHRQAIYEQNGPQLVAELAAAVGAPRATAASLRRLVRLLHTSLSIVVPVVDLSGVCWVLSAWSDGLQPEDIAPVAAFWREATDALDAADRQLRQTKRAAPHQQLARARQQIRPWLTTILQFTREQVDVDSAGVFGVDPDRGVLYVLAIDGVYPSRDPDAYTQPLQRGLAGWAAAGRDPLVANDVHASEYFEPFLPEEREMFSEMVVPIKIQGAVVAVLDCQSRRRDAFRGNRQNLIIEAAQRIETALEQAPATRWMGIEESLSDLEKRLSVEVDPHAIYSMYVYLIADVLNAEECALWLAAPDRDYLTLEASKRLPASSIHAQRAPVGTHDGVGFEGYVAATGEPLRRSGVNIAQDPKWRPADDRRLERYASGQCDSLIMVPVPDPEGRWPCAGVLTCENKLGPGDPPHFTDEDQARLSRFAGVIGSFLPASHAQALRTRQINEELRQAYRDQIHSVRGNLYAATCWRLDGLLDAWQRLDDDSRTAEIAAVQRVLDESMSSLHVIEAQVLNASDQITVIGQALRTLAARYDLLHCVTFEGGVEDYEFDDRRVAGALIQFGREALQNAAKYSRVDTTHSDQIHIRLETDHQWATLTVEDHGVGLQRDPRDTDFAVLRSAVESVGGTFEVRNKPAFSRGLLVCGRVPLTANVRAGSARQTRLDISNGEGHLR